MNDPACTLQRVVGNLGATVGALMEMHDGVDLAFREDGRDDIEPNHRWWFADRVEPVIWFNETWLNAARSNKREAMGWYRRYLKEGQITEDEPEWGFFGPWHVEADRIKLVCANGTWIWMLTGQTCPKIRIDGEPDTLHEAKWPD